MLNFVLTSYSTLVKGEVLSQQMMYISTNKGGLFCKQYLNDGKNREMDLGGKQNSFYLVLFKKCFTEFHVGLNYQVN